MRKQLLLRLNLLLKLWKMNFIKSALTKFQDTAVAVQSLQDIQQIGSLFAKSGMFQDVKSEAQAVVKILAGAELGLSPFAAMAELHVIQGKVTLSAGLLAKKVKASGKYDFRVQELTDKVCSIKFFERSTTGSSEIGTSTFTIEDAKKAQVKNLDKFGRNMLYARAMSNGVRWFCPDATEDISVYTEGEIEHRTQAAPVAEAPVEAEVIPGFEEAEDQSDWIQPETIDAIRKLWPDYGMKEGGKLFDLDQVCLKRWKRKLDEAKEEDAQKLLTWLQDRAMAVEEELNKQPRSEQPQAEAA